MTTTTIPIYEWIKQLPSGVLLQDTAPLMGFPPPFPWEQFSFKLAELFSIDHLDVHPNKCWEWRDPENYSEGLGDQPIILSATVAPSGGGLHWLMPSQDFSILAAKLLKQDIHTFTKVPAEFQEGLLNFLAIEVINLLPQLDYDKSLSVFLTQENTLPSTAMLSLDISFTFSEKTFWGRLLISEELQKKWKERYAQRTLEIPLSSKLNVPVHLEAGEISLSLSEWSDIKLGDFILLDHCSLKPNGEGRIILKVDNFPLFRGKIKEGNIKILEHPLYHEANQSMAANLPPKSPQNEPSHEEEEFADEDLDMEEEPFEEGEEEEELPLEDEEGKEPEENEEPATPPQSTVAAPEEKKTFSPDQIPLSVVVEVGRLEMSIQKLMELQPGNILELNIHPENGVDLVVNGRRIAKGELLVIGEAIGVRILDIG